MFVVFFYYFLLFMLSVKLCDKRWRNNGENISIFNHRFRLPDNLYWISRYRQRIKISYKPSLFRHCHWFLFSLRDICQGVEITYKAIVYYNQILDMFIRVYIYIYRIFNVLYSYVYFIPSSTNLYFKVIKTRLFFLFPTNLTPYKYLVYYSNLQWPNIRSW